MEVPALSFSTFKYARYIADLTEEEFEEAKTSVMAMWSGVFELWSVLDSQTRNMKRQEVFSYLIAWYLADMYPTRLVGGMLGAGGMPISSKSIKSVQLQFRKLNLPDSYEVLATNQFGVKAASMIHYAPEMMGVYG